MSKVINNTTSSVTLEIKLNKAVFFLLLASFSLALCQTLELSRSGLRKKVAALVDTRALGASLKKELGGMRKTLYTVSPLIASKERKVGSYPIFWVDCSPHFPAAVNLISVHGSRPECCDTVLSEEHWPAHTLCGSKPRGFE